MRNKRILIVNQFLSEGDGASRSSSLLANELSKQYDVLFLTFFSNNNGKYNSSNYDIINLDLDKKYFKNIVIRYIYLFFISFKLSDFIKEEKVTDVITNSVGTEIPLILCKLFNDLFNLYIVVRLNPKSLFPPPIKSLFVKYFFKRANKIVSLNDTAKYELENCYSLSNVIKISNFFNITKNIRLSNKELKAEYNFDKFTFITISRLDDVKRVRLIIDAFRKFIIEQGNANLLVLGSGKKIDYLKALTKKYNLGKKVYFTGIVKNVFPYLKKSDCFVFASKKEGFGNVLVESLMLNLPIITTDCKDGPREIVSPELSPFEKVDYPYIGKYGILINSNDENTIIKQMKSMMVELFKNQKLRDKYSDGLKRAKDFDKDKVIEKWLALI